MGTFEESPGWEDSRGLECLDLGDRYNRGGWAHFVNIRVMWFSVYKTILPYSYRTPALTMALCPEAAREAGWEGQPCPGAGTFQLLGSWGSEVRVPGHWRVQAESVYLAGPPHNAPSVLPGLTSCITGPGWAIVVGGGGPSSSPPGDETHPAWSLEEADLSQP